MKFIFSLVVLILIAGHAGAQSKPVPFKHVFLEGLSDGFALTMEGEYHWVYQNTLINSESELQSFLNPLFSPTAMVDVDLYRPWTTAEFDQHYKAELDYDLTKDSLVVIMAGMRPLTGYKLEVLSVQESSTEILIEIEEHRPRWGGTAITYPSIVMKIPKTTKTIKACSAFGCENFAH